MSIPPTPPPNLEQRRRSGQSCDLIDVRTPLEFCDAHVEYARNVPLDQLDPEAIMRARNDKSGEPLFVVCQARSFTKKDSRMSSTSKAVLKRVWPLGYRSFAARKRSRSNGRFGLLRGRWC